MTDIKAERGILKAIAHARDGWDDCELWKPNQPTRCGDYTRTCRICGGAFVVPNLGSSGQFLAAFLHHCRACAHDEIAQQILKDGLHIPDHISQRRLRDLCIPEIQFRQVGVQYLKPYEVYIAPKWLCDLVAAWHAGPLVEAVIQRAADEPMWLDALIAASAVPHGVTTLVAQQL